MAHATVWVLHTEHTDEGTCGEPLAAFASLAKAKAFTAGRFILTSDWAESEVSETLTAQTADGGTTACLRPLAVRA